MKQVIAIVDNPEAYRNTTTPEGKKVVPVGALGHKRYPRNFWAFKQQLGLTSDIYVASPSLAKRLENAGIPFNIGRLEGGQFVTQCMA